MVAGHRRDDKLVLGYGLFLALTAALGRTILWLVGRDLPHHASTTLHLASQTLAIRKLPLASCPTCAVRLSGNAPCIPSGIDRKTPKPILLAASAGSSTHHCSISCFRIGFIAAPSFTCSTIGRPLSARYVPIHLSNRDVHWDNLDGMKDLAGI